MALAREASAKELRLLLTPENKIVLSNQFNFYILKS